MKTVKVIITTIIIITVIIIIIIQIIIAKIIIATVISITDYASQKCIKDVCPCNTIHKHKQKLMYIGGRVNT